MPPYNRRGMRVKSQDRRLLIELNVVPRGQASRAAHLGGPTENRLRSRRDGLAPGETLSNFTQSETQPKMADEPLFSQVMGIDFDQKGYLR